MFGVGAGFGVPRRNGVDLCVSVNKLWNLFICVCGLQM